MRLAEEYIRRHQLPVPVVRFVDNGTLLLRQAIPTGIHWQMITISYRNDAHHPGKFIVTTMRPIYDSPSRSSGRLLFEVQNSVDLEWDEYEQYIINFMRKNPQTTVIKDTAEVVITLWEIFVFSHDSILAHYAKNEYLYNSLDSSLTIAERHQAYTKFSQLFSIQQHQYFDVWQHEMLQYVRLYCYWLANLLDTSSKSQERQYFPRAVWS